MQFVIPRAAVRVPLRFFSTAPPFLRRVAREAIENSYGSNLQMVQRRQTKRCLS